MNETEKVTCKAAYFGVEVLYQPIRFLYESFSPGLVIKIGFKALY